MLKNAQIALKRFWANAQSTGNLEGTVLCRLIAPEWALTLNPSQPRAIEGLFSDEQLLTYNIEQHYNIYYFPNHPSQYKAGQPIVSGPDIDTFQWVFVDYDLKTNTYPTKEAFIEVIANSPISPSGIVDSGNGVHVYWKVTNLDARSYLRFQRRLCRLYKTDEAVGKLMQLMRLPGTLNTKYEKGQVLCEYLYQDDVEYTAEQLDQLLPPIRIEDEDFCNQHYNKTMQLDQALTEVSDQLPAKFGKLMEENPEARALFIGNSQDRSKSDYRLGHLMFASGFTKEEAMSVLINSSKASQRAPIHRINYASNIVDKIWTFEMAEEKEKLTLSSSVRDILRKSELSTTETRFRCHPRIDNTTRGFRLGQVIGLVAGSGVGKTAFALNMFRWFAQENPDYHHFFIPLEQPAKEIAERWNTMCGGDTTLQEKVQIMSNYDDDGNFRHLSFDEIRIYIEKYQKVTGAKVGCVVIDHIGALKKKGSNDENQDLMAICHAMKAFAVQTNTLLVMQSQTSREKAGIGDLELDKDAAYGTTTFEWYCDYLITLWQPLKRCHADEACPTVTAFKFCKIRFKKREDLIKEDVRYYMLFDSSSEQMRDMTQDEITSFNYFLPMATNKRKADRKTDILEYTPVPYKSEVTNDYRTNT